VTFAQVTFAQVTFAQVTFANVTLWQSDRRGVNSAGDGCS
jgi:hypothetical protein